MSKLVEINGNSFTLNEQSDSPPWGEQQSELIGALVDVASTVVAPGDILQTNFSLTDNVVAPTNVTGLDFDPALVRSAIVQYSIYRSTDLQELSECGTMLVTYKSIAASWEVARYSVGESNVVINFTSAGQGQYTSSNMSGTGHMGTLRFTAKAFVQ